MAYNSNTIGSWFGESAGSATQNLYESKSSFEVSHEGKTFAEHFEKLFENYNQSVGIDIKRNLAEMVADRSFMEQYKADLLEPIFEGFMNAAGDEVDPHIQSHIDNVNRLWDAKVRQYSESASTTAFLPIATLEFPVLAKQYFQSIIKDIIEVETVKTPAFTKHIKTTYLVNNATGDMYEYPKCIFDGTWEKVWEAAKGLAYDANEPIDITEGKGWNINLISFATTGDPTVAVDAPADGADGKLNLENRLSYNVRIVAIDYKPTAEGTTLKRIPLRKGGIVPELSTGGTLINGDINFRHSDGTVIQDCISGKVDFRNGTMSVASATGKTVAIYVEGCLSNEDNSRTVSVREFRETRKFTIEDGPRWNMPFTIEEIEDSAALLNMNYYNRMVDEITKTIDMMESQTVIKFFNDEFNKYLGADYDIYNLDSIVMQHYVDLEPPANFAGDPFKYMGNAVQFALKNVIHRLTDAAKLDNLSFVVVGNPMATQLLAEWSAWKVQQGTSVGGIRVNNSYGFLTNMGAPVRIVASNQIPAYSKEKIATGVVEGYTANAKELELRVIAYPTDPEHISFRHLKYTSHVFTSPAQAAYEATSAPHGAHSVVTATSRFKDISIQGLQAKLTLLNSAKVYGRV